MAENKHGFVDPWLRAIFMEDQLGTVRAGGTVTSIARAKWINPERIFEIGYQNRDTERIEPRLQQQQLIR